MKIKKWILVLHMIIIMPIIYGVSIFFVNKLGYIDLFNREFVDINNILQKYDGILSNPKLYSEDSDIEALLDNIDSEVKVEIYLSSGKLIYSSNKNNIEGEKVDVKELYKDLSYVKVIKHNDVIKKPVFNDKDIIGIYKISVDNRDKIRIKSSDISTIIIVFSLMVVGMLLLTLNLINHRIVRPIKDLTFAIKEFKDGKNMNIRCSANDEIGILVKEFNNMKKEVIEKNDIIKKEQGVKEYMIASISHDLKTPITSIRAYTELISSSVDEMKKENYTGVILDRCDYMRDMIDNLLMYTVLTSGYRKEFVEVEGEEFFDMLFEGYNSMCASKGIKFTSLINCRGNYKVNVNEMIRVMDNLVSNAIKHTKKDKNIWVGAFSKDYELPKWIDEDFIDEIDNFRKNGVIIVVKNEGEYIVDEDIENIFKPFYKRDKSRQLDGGTGIGLSIVKLIVEQHGGFVKVFPKKGTGNIFVCYLKRLN